jgi:hypothetical protein
MEHLPSQPETNHACSYRSIHCHVSHAPVYAKAKATLKAAFVMNC